MRTGLYEILQDVKIQDKLNELSTSLHPQESAFRDAEAADRLAFHLARVIEQAVSTFPEKNRAERGVELAVVGMVHIHSKSPCFFSWLSSFKFPAKDFNREVNLVSLITTHNARAVFQHD